jgi:hypothetical protein
MVQLAEEYMIPIRYPFRKAGSKIILSDQTEDLLITSRGFVDSVLKGRSIYHPDAMIGSFYGDAISVQGLVHLLEEVPEGWTEIMCHP